jgi:hypothetical protein
VDPVRAVLGGIGLSQDQVPCLGGDLVAEELGNGGRHGMGGVSVRSSILLAISAPAGNVAADRRRRWWSLRL